MLVIDDTLLSDYLDGVPAARSFLRKYEGASWAVPSIVSYEAYMGSLHGFIGGGTYRRFGQRSRHPWTCSR